MFLDPGNGWDQRQRVCSYGDYDARDPDTSGGGWYKRPTLQGVLGSLTPNEALILTNRAPNLVRRLGGLPAPGPRETFDHHLTVLTSVIGALQAVSDPQQKYRDLSLLYKIARAEWPDVQRNSSSPLGAPAWIDALANGLTRLNS
jgi:hypothetical protein